MSRDTNVEVAHIDLKGRQVILADGSVRLIANMLDDDGDETDDPNEVSVVTFKFAEQQWCVVSVSDWDTGTLQ